METSPRILFVVDSISLPGTASQLKLLAGNLALAGFEIHIATLSDAVGSPTGLAQIPIVVHPLNCRTSQPQRPTHQSIAIASALRTVIKTVRPQFVHQWDCDANAEITLAIRGLAAVRVLETVSTRQLRKPFVRQRLERTFVPAAETTIAPHESLVAPLVKAGRNADRIKIIGNGAPAQSMDRAEAKTILTQQLGLPDTIYLAGTIAPLQPRFRLKDLVWATDLLSCIRNDFHFVLVGTGHQRARLEKFISQTEATGHVHFIDQPHSGISDAAIQAGLDVYWNSHLNAPNPSSLLHAMAAGVPAISVLGDGTRELIRHQETAFAVNFGARDEFARWTKYLIEQTHSATQIRLQAQQFVRQEFPAATMIAQYRTIYES